MNIHELEKCIGSLTIDSSGKLGLLDKFIKSYKRIFILGNGGSNAISTHIAQDYTKILSKQAFCFGDSSRMSCYANDYGWESAYKRFLEQFLNNSEEDLVILISSSGESRNIVKALEYCMEHDFPVILLTGFDSFNKCRLTAKGYSKLLIDLHIPSFDYGVVEITHEAFLHTVC